MTPDQFVHHYPRLYHMAEYGTWDSIQRHGLLSTAAILDICEIQGQRRNSLEARRRPEKVALSHPEHGSFTLRDQKPLKDSLLEQALEDCTVADWYTILNARVFFWPTSERVDYLLNARAYRNEPHTVLTVDTAALVEEYAEVVKLARINTGATIYTATPRGLTTFKWIRDWPDAVGPRSGKLSTPIAEATIEYKVGNIADFVVKVEERQGDSVLKEVWSR